MTSIGHKKPDPKEINAKGRAQKYLDGVDVSMPIEVMGKGRIKELVQRKRGGCDSKIRNTAAQALERIQGSSPRDTDIPVEKGNSNLLAGRSVSKAPNTKTIEELGENPFGIHSEELHDDFSLRARPDPNKILHAYARLKAKEYQNVARRKAEAYRAVEQARKLANRTVEDKLSRSVRELLGVVGGKSIRNVGAESLLGGCPETPPDQRGKFSSKKTPKKNTAVHVSPQRKLSPLTESPTLRKLPLPGPVDSKRSVSSMGVPLPLPDFTGGTSKSVSIALVGAQRSPSPLSMSGSKRRLSPLSNSKRSLSPLSISVSMRRSGTLWKRAKTIMKQSAPESTAKAPPKLEKVRHYRGQESGGVALRVEVEEKEIGVRTAGTLFYPTQKEQLSTLFNEWKIIDELCSNCVHYDDVIGFMTDVRLTPFPRQWLVNERIRQRGSGIVTFGRYLLLMLPHLPIKLLDEAVRTELCLPTHRTVETDGWLQQNTALCSSQERSDEDDHAQFFDFLYQRHMTLWVDDTGFSSKPLLLRQLYQLYDRYRDEGTKKGISFRRFHRQFRSTLSDDHLKSMFLSAKSDNNEGRSSRDLSASGGEKSDAVGVGGAGFSALGYLSFRQYAILLWPGFSGQVQVDAEAAQAIHALAMSSMAEERALNGQGRKNGKGGGAPLPPVLIGIKESVDKEIFRMFDMPPEAH